MKCKAHFTKRFILRPLESSDYDTWFRYYTERNPPLNRFDTDRKTAKECDREQFRAVLKRYAAAQKERRYFVYVCFDRKTNEMMGVVDLFIICRGRYQMANVGYQVHNKHWGKGYGKEMVLGLARIAFREFKLNRLEVAIEEDNVNSIALAKAIGMKSEGLRRNYIFENNRWVDHLAYTLIPEDIGLKSQKPPKD